MEKFEKPDLLKIKIFSLNPGFLINYEILYLEEKTLIGFEEELSINDSFEIIENLWGEF